MILFQVRTLVRESFRAALEENDILISPAAPSAAYKIGMLFLAFAFTSTDVSTLQFCLNIFFFSFFLFRKTLLLKGYTNSDYDT